MDAMAVSPPYACPWFARRRFYQRFCDGATTRKRRQCEDDSGILPANTPTVGLFPHPPQQPPRRPARVVATT